MTTEEQQALNTKLLRNNIDKSKREKIKNHIQGNACCFYERMKIEKGDTIFTTTSYVRSVKRVNYCALLNDDRFFLIENFVFIEGAPKHCEVFIFGRTLGTVSIKTYSPLPIGSQQFITISGQTAKVFGMS